MPDQLRTECLQDPQAIDALRDQWDALAGGTPFRRWDWLGPWWSAYGEPHELFVVAAFDDAGKMTGAAPFYREHSLTAGRKLKLLGSGKVCSDYMTILCRPGLEAEVLRSTAAWMTRNAGDAKHGWDLLELENIADVEPLWPQWFAALRNAGNLVQSRTALSCWQINELTDWEQYLSRLSKTHRKRIRRWLDRDLASDQFVARRAEDADSFQKGWNALVDLHQRRWSARGVEGCYSCQRFTAFLHEAAWRFLQSQRLNLCWIEDEGRPVAAQIDFVDEQGGFSYQAGIDPEVNGYSPGHILQAHALHEAVVRQGCGRYDFLRGDEGYKTHWRAEATACSTVRVTPNTTLAKLRSGAWSTGQALKSWIKAGIGRDETSA